MASGKRRTLVGVTLMGVAGYWLWNYTQQAPGVQPPPYQPPPYVPPPPEPPPPGGGLVSFADAAFLLSKRPDILDNFGKWGWDTGRGNWVAIVSEWWRITDEKARWGGDIQKYLAYLRGQPAPPPEPVPPEPVPPEKPTVLSSLRFWPTEGVAWPTVVKIAHGALFYPIVQFRYRGPARGRDRMLWVGVGIGREHEQITRFISTTVVIPFEALWDVLVAPLGKRWPPGPGSWGPGKYGAEVWVREKSSGGHPYLGRFYFPAYDQISWTADLPGI